MDEEHTRLDFPCFHDDEGLCDSCIAKLESKRSWATAVRQRDKTWSWREETMKKLRLEQDAAIVKAITAAKPNLPPLTPMPDCDLCGEPSGLVTPNRQAFCGPCWRAVAPRKEE